MRRQSIRRALTFAVTGAVFAASAAAFGAGIGAADTADPVIAEKKALADPVSADGSKIDRVLVHDDQHLTLQVYSAAMGRDIPVEVQRPADTSAPRPVLYLLSGADGNVGTANWDSSSNVLPFLAGKNVNVVQPVGGAWSYYTDWVADDPVQGRAPKWKTFLGEELPPLIDAALGTNGIHSIVGMSMSANSVLALAVAHPELYRGVASYSGCDETSDPLGRQAVKTVLSYGGGGDPVNMWGTDDNPAWTDNDAVLHADRLRGIDLYLYSGSGLPGRWDTVDSPFLQKPGPAGVANEDLVGGFIEAGANICTHNMQTRLTQLGIPATFNFAPTGTHSWGYWQDAFYDSWPMLSRDLGL
ncbi:alpha/beta hydrolase [Nocardia sp. NPDC020380]|uniref:alpha/beta hydrolase n=1 Tax=Nocardia sp. NPDC020380 TaxID=3364309 RepID=UPI00379C2B0B